ncbi:hypothetical protein [Flavihumibacter sp.]|uniref:hypothetical protein n=1 Tax=Flavihumibacter sp. TaxID=1913981 RepID=UPI002FCB33FC|nr:hypothetical protein [Flavihumibacter sediminis]
MQLAYAVRNAFDQLQDILQQLSPEQYTQSCSTLSGATIGQHNRHIIEMYQCLLEGYENGKVNYEERRRDIRIESDPVLAVELLENICKMLERSNKPMNLHAGYDAATMETIQLETNYHREIAYNLEHTIHHMALIKVGLLDLPGIRIPEGFGVASSTMKYRNACAQ